MFFVVVELVPFKTLFKFKTFKVFRLTDIQNVQIADGKRNQKKENTINYFDLEKQVSFSNWLMWFAVDVVVWKTNFDLAVGWTLGEYQLQLIHSTIWISHHCGQQNYHTEREKFTKEKSNCIEHFFAKSECWILNFLKLPFSDCDGK